MKPFYLSCIFSLLNHLGNQFRLKKLWSNPSCRIQQRGLCETTLAAADFAMQIYNGLKLWVSTKELLRMRPIQTHRWADEGGRTSLRHQKCMFSHCCYNTSITGKPHSQPAVWYSIFIMWLKSVPPSLGDISHLPKSCSFTVLSAWLIQRFSVYLN